MVCGECCTLTEGGTRLWAVCLDCDRKKGRSLTGVWRGFGVWLVGLLLVMALVIAILEYVFT
jgi:hypothetical protein